MTPIISTPHIQLICYTNYITDGTQKTSQIHDEHAGQPRVGDFTTTAMSGPLTESDASSCVVWLFVLSAIFWSGFEQAGSSMGTCLRRTDQPQRDGLGMPTSWLQSVNRSSHHHPRPVAGFLWTWLARRNKNPSIPLKFALGLLGLSAGFFVLAWGAAGATKEGSVAITWLVVTYFLHTVGELCLSPVGLSSITKLAPRDRISQMMGLWFVATALGNLFAGPLTTGTLENKSAGDVFSSVAIDGVAGLVAVAGAPFVKRVMGKIE